MDAIEILEQLGQAEPADPDVLERTAKLLQALAATEERPSGARAAISAGRTTGSRHGREADQGQDGGRRSAEGFTQNNRARRWGPRVAAAAVVVVGVSGGANLIQRSGQSTAPVRAIRTTPAPAAAVLKGLALVAAEQTAPTAVGPGQYLYVESTGAYTSTYGADTAANAPSPSLVPAPTTTPELAQTNGGVGTTPTSATPLSSSTSGVPVTALPPVSSSSNATRQYSVLVPQHRQAWTALNGSGRVIETYGQPVFLSSQDRSIWQGAGQPTLTQGPMDISVPPVIDPAFGGGVNLSDLSTDPAALGAEISAHRIEPAASGPAQDFYLIGDLVRETNASSALRSALYKVAAGLPGIESLGTVTDHSGRSGIGVAYVDRGLRHELIFDPTTSALLGESDTLVGSASGYDHIPVGTVVGWSDYLRSFVVDSLAPDSAESQQPVTSVPLPTAS